jgi:hypothetical protein
MKIMQDCPTFLLINSAHSANKIDMIFLYLREVFLMTYIVWKQSKTDLFYPKICSKQVNMILIKSLSFHYLSFVEVNEVAYLRLK